MKTQAQSNRESKWRGIGSASSIGIFAEQAFWRAAEARLIPGNSARVLKDAAENYPAWLEAIESAQHTIHFESYVIHGRNSEDDQAHFIASGLGFNYCMGHNRELKGGVYGNLALSRFPLLGSENHDISVAGREERGCLRVDVSPGKESRLHVYNVHLGASFI